MEHLYLDAASTEPVGGNVISVMMPFLTEARVYRSRFGRASG